LMISAACERVKDVFRQNIISNQKNHY